MSIEEKENESSLSVILAPIRCCAEFLSRKSALFGAHRESDFSPRAQKGSGKNNAHRRVEGNIRSLKSMARWYVNAQDNVCPVQHTAEI